MADEGNASRSRRMDLNLYLGLPRSPRTRHRDLGSDLALNSLPLHSPTTAPDSMSAASPPPVDPVLPLQDNPTLQPVVPDELSHAPNDGVPPDPPVTTTPHSGHDEADSGPYPPTLAPAGGSSAEGDDGSSSRQEFLRDPEFRFRRLIESSRRLQLRRFRPSRGERSDSFAHYLPTAEQLMRDIMSSQRVLEATLKHRGCAEGIAVEGEEAEAEDMSKSVANFECNICLDLAKDPVVTSCGHLFCWSCLYQWLHLHCDHSECPVCKGEVVDAKITPIYGRGSMEATVEEKSGDDGELGLKIPPRPRGHRFESLRQQLQRPISRRLGEGSPISRSRILDGENANLQGLLDGARRMVLSRLREWRTQREEGNTESESNTRDMGLPRYNTSDPQINTTSSLRDEIDHGHRPPLYGLASTYGSAALSAADLGRVVWRFESGSSQAGASTSSVNNRDPEPPLTRPPSEATLASDQASASSTLAVIQGDTAVNDAPAEPYSAGSSRLLRRRGRSGTYGSLDVDGGELHARKRRRLN